MKPLSLNQYSYTGNNSVMYDDPSGHVAFLAVTGIIGAAVGGAIGAYKAYQSNENADIIDLAKGFAKGAVIGGAIGLGAGAAGGALFAGTAMATTTSVATGATIWATTTIGGMTATATAAYQTARYATSSLEAAKTVLYNTTARYGPTIVSEAVDIGTDLFSGDLEGYGINKLEQIALSALPGPAKARLTKIY